MELRGVTFIVALLTALSLTVGYARADQQRLNANPGFEAGTSGWNQDKVGTNNAVFTVLGTGHTGSASAQVAITTYTDGDAKWAFAPISVRAGDFITFSDWYRSDVETNIFRHYVPAGGSPETAVIEFLAVVPASADFNVWTQVSKSFVATQTGTLVIAHVLQSTGTLVTDDYSVVEFEEPTALAQGLVTLTFDDGWDTFGENAFPLILRPAGMKSTAYIISKANVEGSEDYMSNALIEAFEDSGLVEIGAHSRNHLDLVNEPLPSSLYANHAAMWEGEIGGSRTDLLDSGFAPVTAFAYPFGQYNDGLEAQVEAAGYTSARTTHEGYNDKTTDRFALRQQSITIDTTVVEAQGWIDFALTKKVWLIMTFHDVRPNKVECIVRGSTPAVQDSDCTDSTTLQGIVNYLATKPAGTVVTMGQAVAAIDAQPSHTITAPPEINGTSAASR